MANKPTGREITDAFKAGQRSVQQAMAGGSPGEPPPKEKEGIPPLRSPKPTKDNPRGVPFDPPKGLAHHNPDQPDNILNHILYTPDGRIWGVNIPGKGPQPLNDQLRQLIQQEQMKHQQSMMISDTRNLQKGPPPHMTGVDKAVGQYPGRDAPADLRIDPLRKGVKAYQQQIGLA